MLLAVLGMFISAATEPAFAAIMKPLLDGSFVDRDPEIIRWVPIVMVAIFLARGVSTFVTDFLMIRVGRQVVKQFRSNMFSQYLAMPARFFDQSTSGDLISKMTYDVEQVAAAATSAITVLIRDTLTVIGLLAWMLYLSWQMTLGILLISPVVMLTIVFVTKRFRRISKRIQGSMGQVTHVTQEMIEGQRVIKAFGGQAYERAHFEQANENNRRLHVKMALTKSATAPIIQFLVALVLAGIIMFATREEFHDTLSVGTFMSFMTAMMMILTPIRRLTNVNATIQQGIAAGESLFAVLDQTPERDTGTQVIKRATGHLDFNDVSFRYADNSGPVLDSISFSMQAGETIALVGRSGSGKSTLANLVPRFYETSTGKISLDGVSLQDITLESLRDQIAYVGQNTTLFNDSIRNNIAYGHLNSASEKSIVAAAKAANAWEFIEQLPQGLDTEVGEQGALLSGGQRQRLSIARALLKDAPLLILDEATASLDSESERHIQTALERLSQNRTTLVIAHRLSTIENADRILVMDAGKIVESGTHHELLQKQGAYARLHQLQFGSPLNEA